MKFLCKKYSPELYWNRWFAWYPIQVFTDTDSCWVWWETVEYHENYPLQSGDVYISYRKIKDAINH